MEWSLTQNKLLAFHRLMRTDKPIGALLLLWPTLWALRHTDFAGYHPARRKASGSEPARPGESEEGDFSAG